MSAPKKRTRSRKLPHVTREEARRAQKADPSGHALAQLLIERKVGVRITRDNEPIVPLPSLG